MIKIRVLDSCVGTDFVYAKGGIYDAPDERAKDLIKGGLAELAAPQVKPERAEAPPMEKRHKKK